MSPVCRGGVFFWQKSLRILEIDSVGEKFSEIETLARGSPYEKDFGGDLSLPLVAGVCGTTRKCLTICDPLLGFAFNAPTDSAFLERFLGILIGLPQVCWIGTCHAPLLIGYLSLEVSSHLK